MDRLKFHTQCMPEMEEVGARYVVVAYHGDWRDGLTTNYKAEIPKLQRELRKCFMNRYSAETEQKADAVEEVDRLPRVKG